MAKQIDYERAVAEGKRLVKRSEDDQWKLAELTYRQVEAGVSLHQWSRDIGIDRAAATRLRQIWQRWGGDNVTPRPSFRDADAAVRTGDENPEGASARQWEQNARRHLGRMAPERQAEIVSEMVSRPEVAREIAKDDSTVEAVYQAQIEVNRTREPVGSGLAEEHAKRAGATAARNIGRAMGEEDDAMVIMHLRRAAHELAEAMYVRETFKVAVNPDREREALEAIDRMLSAYRVNDPMAELSDTDRSILSDLGLVNP